jgi:NADPH:quinone reductase-like Zn-dependent oxidoreductase
MRAMRLQAYGDVDQFKLDDVPVPTPEAGEVLMRVHASAVNHLDLVVRQGVRAQQWPMDLPATLGGDAAGVIEGLGAGVTGFAVGDRVIAHFRQRGKGPHADYAVVPVAGVAHLPEGMSFEDGATLPQVGLTGRQIVDVVAPQAGERVLVAGAGSAVGRVAVQYLRELGAHVVAGVLPDEMDEARDRADEVIDITVAPEAPGFDKAVVTVMPAAKNGLLHVRAGGKVGAPVPRPEGFREEVDYTRIAHQDDPVMLDKVARAAGRGELTIPIAQIFPLEQLADAHVAMTKAPRGKIVIRH